ncbi:MAG: arsenate reductase [Gammaproteobacteria bacterium]|nr:arsenate reductase [Gammaproteobacteria bacterium]MYF53048.1 arsenate reductase [Gammaproteobacteria bacterium]MYK43765.1 arsenate reductase [Gammaproteobacteria bacterium]
MSKITIYFNPRCSKCRSTLELIQVRNKEVEIIHYLEQPPSRNRLIELVSTLEDTPSDLIRRDLNFKNLGLNHDHCQTIEQIVELLEQHPELLQRPILVRGGSATIARSPERVLEFISN